MKQFFSDYLNIKKIIEEKREYKKMMARVDALPDDYRYVYKEIQSYMWRFATGSGNDILEIQYGLIELFEEGAAEGKRVLEVTGDDVATFVEELLKNVRTYERDRRSRLNRKIKKSKSVTG